jgi:hypothetical protein
VTELMPVLDLLATRAGARLEVARKATYVLSDCRSSL